ncbi:MAG: ABC transporter permease [Bacteroidota bacterium]
MGPEYPAVVGLRMKAGSFFAEGDVTARSSMTVISEEAARLLFGGAGQAVGRTILTIEGAGLKTAYRVIGVYASPPPLMRQAFGIT